MKAEINQEAVLPKILEPKNEYDLIRVGRDNDGGYLVSEQSIFDSEMLLSAGIAWDFSFEKQYIHLTNNTIKCFDHTINIKHYFFTWFGILLQRLLFFSNLKKIRSAFIKLLNPIKFKKFIKNKKVNFFKIGLGIGDSRYMSLKDIINKFTKNEKIFLKIDIEGDEYRLINDLLKFSNRIAGLIIEFHYVDIHLDRIIDFVKKIDLTLVHTHINNAGPIIEKKIPTLIELTFAKNPKKIGDLKNIKHLLDQPNLKDKENPELKFE